MTTKLRMSWFIPTTGDSRHTLTSGSATWNIEEAVAASEREPSFEYLTQIARAADQLGYAAVLIPTGSWCHDAWSVATALATQTKNLEFLVAVRPGLISPTVQAQMIRTFQAFSNNRLRINVVAGGESVEQRRFGDTLEKVERYQRANEYVDVLRQVLAGEHVTYEGQHVAVEDAFLPESVQMPPVYLGGSSDAALEVAAQNSDVYLTWGEPVARAAEKIGRVRDAADKEGRTLEYGVRLHVIARPTSEEAWRIADDLVASIPEEHITQAKQEFTNSGSTGQRRMAELQTGGRSREDLTLEPNLWSGVGLVRGGAGTALVGSFDEVADAIIRYAEAGFGEFIMSGFPHLEESYWFAEGVMPILRRRGWL